MIKDPRLIRQRALRAIYGGLLVSSLSETELMTLANELDLRFLEELRALLQGLTRLEQADYYSDDTFEKQYSTEPELADMIYERCKMKRMSKDKVLGYMSEIDPNIASRVTRMSLTLRESILEFLLSAGVDSASRLWLKVSGYPEQDPYLVGITNRK